MAAHVKAAARSTRKQAGKPQPKKIQPSKTRISQGRSSSHGSRTGGEPRSLWAGNIRLNLVSVPVRLHAATKSGARLAFHQVHKPSGKRIRYEKVAPGIGPVEVDDIVKGFEVAKGEYVLLSDEELDAVKIEARRTLDLVQFVDQCEVDPIWFDRPYYVVPDGEFAEEAYGVLRDALRATRKMGIGQFAIRGREYVAALKPSGRGLLLETMRFADEVRNAAPFFAELSNEKPDKELLQLAEQLIKRKTAPFDPKRFRDDYTEALKALIATKRKTRKPISVTEDEAPQRESNVIDLVEALKRSVRGSGGAPDKPRRKAG